MTWAYDLTAAFYDEDMGRNNDGRDIAWYLAQTRACGARSILELGCGTGRVTLPLAAAGIEVVAADISVPMLHELDAKAAAVQLPARIRTLAMDMGRWGIAERFDAILCPFSAFTYLVDDGDRARMLAGVRDCLAPGAPLLLDVFVPDPALDARRDGEPIDDYMRPLNSARWSPAISLARSKRLTRDVRSGVNRIERHYRFFDAGGAIVREVRTESLQCPYAPAELIDALAAAGYAEIRACGDFDEAMPAAAPARTIAVIARTGSR
jgi:SAM-dependent methyltransferase